jgi:hypothetical protein
MKKLDWFWIGVGIVDIAYGGYTLAQHNFFWAGYNIAAGAVLIIILILMQEKSS